jgi:hypothetical protein
MGAASFVFPPEVTPWAKNHALRMRNTSSLLMLMMQAACLFINGYFAIAFQVPWVDYGMKRFKFVFEIANYVFVVKGIIILLLNIVHFKRNSLVNQVVFRSTVFVLWRAIRFVQRFKHLVSHNLIIHFRFMLDVSFIFVCMLMNDIYPCLTRP